MPVTLENLTYVYQKNTPFQQTALQNVNFTINGGEILGVMGAAGSGKSTLLQCLNGLLKPTAGRVILDGNDINKLSTRELSQVRRDIALVFQYPEQQIFETKVYDEVAFGPRNQGLKPAETENRVREALMHTGLTYDEFKNKNTSSLSSGEKRRVAIAGILALKARYLLLDEPTAGLDFEGRVKLLKYLSDLNRKYQTTIVIVSHDINLLVSNCDRILILDAGQIYLKGCPGELLTHYDMLKARGIELPVFQRLVYELNKRGWGLNPGVRNSAETGREIAKKIKLHD